MPVYVCRPGQSSAEPWKHGVQVYARPFPIDPPAQARALARANATADLLVREGRAASSSPSSSPPTPAQAPAQAQAAAASVHRAAAAAAADGAAGGAPVRRVRHSEVVLSDEVSVAHGRYWLRLRWPGSRGGVAGYIALGTVADNEIGTDPGADPPAALAADLQKSGEFSSPMVGAGRRCVVRLFVRREGAHAPPPQEVSRRMPAHNDPPPSSPIALPIPDQRDTGSPPPTAEAVTEIALATSDPDLPPPPTVWPPPRRSPGPPVAPTPRP